MQKRLLFILFKILKSITSAYGAVDTGHGIGYNFAIVNRSHFCYFQKNRTENKICRLCEVYVKLK